MKRIMGNKAWKAGLYRKNLNTPRGFDILLTLMKLCRTYRILWLIEAVALFRKHQYVLCMKETACQITARAFVYVDDIPLLLYSK